MLKHILIVEDSPEFSDLIKKIFESRKITENIVFAKDGIEAILKINNQEFDLIICDKDLPKTNGLEFLKHAVKNKKISPNKIIFMSGNINQDDLDVLIFHGIKSCLVKPFDLNRLVNEVTVVFNLEG